MTKVCTTKIPSWISEAVEYREIMNKVNNKIPPSTEGFRYLCSLIRDKIILLSLFSLFYTNGKSFTMLRKDAHKC